MKFMWNLRSDLWGAMSGTISSSYWPFVSFAVEFDDVAGQPIYFWTKFTTFTFRTQVQPPFIGCFGLPEIYLLERVKFQWFLLSFPNSYLNKQFDDQPGTVQKCANRRSLADSFFFSRPFHGFHVLQDYMFNNAFNTGVCHGEFTLSIKSSLNAVY